MGIRKTVGENLRRIRRQKGVTQEQLALRTGIDRAYMSGIERGVKNPTVNLLERIAMELEVTVNDLTAISHTSEPMPKNLVRGRHVRKK